MFGNSASRAQGNNAEAALYNISIGAVFSGVGALINKEKSDKLLPVILKGMYKGAIGGYLVYESKNLVGRIASKRKLEYSWPAKIVNSAGISIIENAALNKPILSQYNLNIGFNRLEFHFKDTFKFRYQIYPAAFLATAYVALNSKFELERSLRTGNFIFSKAEIERIGLSNNPVGYELGTAIVMRQDQLENYRTISHEIIHVYQYYDFNFVNTSLKPVFDVINSNFKLFEFLDSIFYYDVQAPVLGILYQIENENADSYYDNFFEQEAKFYSTKY